MRAAVLTFVAMIALAMACQSPFDESVAFGQDKEAVEKFMKSFSEPIRIAESKPVTVKDVRFAVVAQTNWQPAKPDKNFPMVAPIEIQLRITNLSKSDVIFPTFHTFGIKILNADGKEVKPRSVSKGDFSTRPILLSPGASFSLCRRAELRWDEKTSAAELVYFDGTGSRSVTGPLSPGRYKLFFWYSVSPEKQEKQKDHAVASWVGEAVTNEVAIEVFDGTTRGIVTGEQELREYTEVVRIRESEPVTLNDAKFVIVAQTDWKAQADWKPGKRVKGVPIEIRLRITNLGKTDLILPTFDTFGLKLSSADGKTIMPGGGRKLTRLTRPILLPPGCSYSLGPDDATNNTHRRAELRWNPKTKTSQLDYYDGTGYVAFYEPLSAGRYNLAFWYRVRANGLFKTERGAATWIGAAVTENIVIEMHNP